MKTKYDYSDKNWGFSPITSLITNFSGFEIAFFIRYLKRRININKKKVLLDLGCGGGAVSGFFKKKYPMWDIKGLDISATAIKGTKNKYKNITFIRSDANNIPLGAKSVDVVVCLDSFEHFENIEKVLFEVDRILKDDGIFYIAVPLSKQKFTLYWLIFKIGYKAFDEIVGHVNVFDDKSLRKSIEEHKYILEEKKFMYHLIFSIFNILYSLFLLAINRHIAFESSTLEMRDSLIKSILVSIRKFFSTIFFIESSLFGWFPGGKGLYIYKKST